CALVLPDSFLLGKYFRGVRQHVLAGGSRVRTLLMFQDSFWEEGEVGRPIVLIAGYRSSDSGDSIRLIYSENLESFAAGNNTYRNSIPSDTYSQTPLSRFYFFLSDEDLEMYRRVTTNAVELATVVKFYSGLIARGGQASIVFDESSATRSGWRISKLVQSG